jgi:hypothetical protein
MKSIIQKNPTRCFLCGKNGNADPLDEHHVFFGPFRKKSERYGAKVYLCHRGCHIFGKNSVHKNHDVCLRVQRAVQRYMMRYYDWTYEDFINIFGRSYL